LVGNIAVFRVCSITGLFQGLKLRNKLLIIALKTGSIKKQEPRLKLL